MQTKNKNCSLVHLSSVPCSSAISECMSMWATSGSCIVQKDKRAAPGYLPLNPTMRQEASLESELCPG